VDLQFIMWDWNGTLLDDVGASLAAVNTMLAVRGRSAIDLAAYRAAIGVPIRCFYETHFDLTREDYHGILLEYGKNYAAQLPSCSLAEGTLPLLKSVMKRGTEQLILTSSEQGGAERALEQYGVEKYFSAVLGAKDTLAGSKLERAREFVENNGIPPERLLLVGDLPHDYEVARALGAHCVLVDWGHGMLSSQKLAGVRIVSSMAELAGLITMV
jgi:phosphoglycolate phosphatase